MRPLEGIRVLDLTRVLAGPYATMALAELGAEVIKVEDPGAPDYTRSIPPFAGEISHYFLAVNRGKRSVVLDLKDPAGRRAGQALAATCDIVVENFRPGVLARLGLGYETLRERHPGIIVCSLSGFGQDGPFAGEPAMDVIVQAITGAMALNGDPDGPPTKLSLPMGDVAGSLWATIGILAALHHRDATGEGAHVDVPLFDSLVNLSSYLAQMYLVTGEEPPRSGNRHHTVPGFGRYATRTGDLALSVQMDPLWRRFCAAARRPDLATDPRYATVPERQKRFAEVEAIVAGALAAGDLDDWLRRLREAGVPAGPVTSLSGALEGDYARSRGLVQELEQPGAGPVRVLAPVVRFGGEPAAPPEPAPALGADTRKQLALAGLAEEDIDALVRA
ncbi:CoA transferase [Solirubrobacter ginsenosidimutans]|uniref:CoA transferase n=1 Tax=Solirubrobacter ginsenosidimutans TaxID=490573 RepID=A0A9X3MN42_9ACTN|nr:CoA transferase [Solirubrobacter ginsenosidimutans]MDA0159237.1 CoA transferase [Solirubrobacter ginsenosidimutans]